VSDGFGKTRGGHTPAMDSGHLETHLLGTQDLMAREGRSIIDRARERGVVLRLLGGLAVHEHCAGFVACRREHLDLDLVGLRRQMDKTVALFAELGYQERVHVRMATEFMQAQFVRACAHAGPDGAPVHEEDHVDVFFDRFKLDHTIDLRERLDLHPYAIPLTDALAIKLQMHAPESRDLRDMLMLLATAPGEGQGGAELDPERLGDLCGHDWGLFYDVTRNLQLLRESLPGSILDEAEREKVAASLARLTGAVDAAPKTLAWRLRARVGTHRPWWDVVEDQDGSPD
jgi:hypothetical protein